MVTVFFSFSFWRRAVASVNIYWAAFIFLRGVGDSSLFRPSINILVVFRCSIQGSAREKKQLGGGLRHGLVDGGDVVREGRHLLAELGDLGRELLRLRRQRRHLVAGLRRAAVFFRKKPRISSRVLGSCFYVGLSSRVLSFSCRIPG